METYLKKFVVIQPGDWPAQFFGRQIVYQSLLQHDKFKASTPGQKTHSSTTSQVNDNFPPMTSIIPTMGPLHISLNSREHVFETFKPLFKTVYTYLFPNCQLADKPKPWRINLILETVYGGWTLIRNQVMSKNKSSKDYQYGVLFNLLDNYLPLVLTIFTVTFKRNNFGEYFNAMIRIWVMFMCFKRRHYNKSPLVWLSNTCHWKDKHRELYEQFCTWPAIYDEYPVENTHSIIRAQTKPSDTANKLQQRAKSIFESKTKQANFRSIFTPPKQFSFSQKQINYLKVRCAEVLTNIFIAISKNIGAASTVIKRGKKYVQLPHVFGQDCIKYTVLPLGFNVCQEPNQDCICDLNSCTISNDDEPWKVFQGCWHSFHEHCLNGSPFCALCQKLLESKTKELASSAKAAIFTPDPNSATKSVPESDDESSMMMETPPSEDNQKLDETIKSLSEKIANLTPIPRPLYHNKQNDSQVDLCLPSTSSQPLRSSSAEDNCQPLTELQNIQHHQHQNTSSFTERFLPLNVCQTNVTGMPMASNACTIISSLWCRRFLLDKFAISSICKHGMLFEDIVNSYRQTIFTGNVLYNSLNLPPHQPNLEVRDVVDRIKDLQLKILSDVGFFDVNQLKTAFIKMLQDGCKHSGVLIIPPDNSVTVLIENEQIAVFDSHQHGENGGLVLSCGFDKVDMMLNCLGKSHNLCGSNFAELGLTQ